MIKILRSELYKFLGVASLVTWVIGAGCEKNDQASSNKALMAVTNVAPDAKPFNIFLGGTNLTPGGKLPYGSTTGSQGNPYLTGVAGVNNFQAVPDSAAPYVTGNINLLINNNYSVFIFDTVSAGQLKSLVMQDNLNAPATSNSGIRFLNFSFDTVGLVPIIGTDTLGLYSIPYAGTIEDPTAVSVFQNFLSGTYQIIIVIGTNIVGIDSISFSPGKNYTLFSMPDSVDPTGPPVLRTIQHN